MIAETVSEATVRLRQELDNSLTYISQLGAQMHQNLSTHTFAFLDQAKEDVLRRYLLVIELECGPK